MAQPALSRQIQDLEDEIGFELFDRLPRGVKISTAGKLFLEDTRRILEHVQARMRAERLARGQTGTLRVGFVESISWHGVLPESFGQFRQRHPDAELQLHPLRSPEQVEALRSGRLDAGFVFSMVKLDRELARLQVALHSVVLATPKGHPLTKSKGLRLRDLSDAAFIWFPKRESPVYYDRVMHECFRGGLKTPHIIQEAVSEATILSPVVQARCGVRQRGYTLAMSRRRGFAAGNRFGRAVTFCSCVAKRQCSSVAGKFVADVRLLPEMKTFGKG